MELFGLNLLNGWVYSSLLMLTAMGLTMVFGLGRVVNFAMGVFYALGAYFILTFEPRLGSYWPVLLIGPILVAPIGLILERSLIRPVRDHPEIYTLLVTFAIAIMFGGIITTGWGTASFFPAAPIGGAQPILSGLYPNWRIVGGAIATVTAVAVYLGINSTSAGLRVRAGSENGLMASILGLNTLRLNSLVFGLSAGLAAFAGVLAGPMFTVRPVMGNDFLIDSFLAVVIGGLGSLRGAIVGAFIIGVQKNIIIQWIDAQWAFAIGFAIVAAIILFRPTGIFGEGRVE